MRIKLFVLSLVVAAVSCGQRQKGSIAPSNRYACYFSVGDSVVVSVSPYDGIADTLIISAPLGNVVCMSTSYVACLQEIGADSVVTGVSGVRFVSDSLVRERAVEVGYEAAPDYERIVGLKPDVVFAYSVSASLPQYVTKLRSLGIRVFMLYEHLENHPLARAEYVRLFGALTGRRALADSVFDGVAARYLELASKVADAVVTPRKVLINMPYGDQWYIPGGDSYMSRLVTDAGGVILGAEAGETKSSVISVEKAFALSGEADIWLHPGMCRTRDQIRSAHPLFEDFPVIRRDIYNNILRSTPGGGNDFWESGAVRPDLVLSDLVAILHPEVAGESVLHYYIKVEQGSVGEGGGDVCGAVGSVAEMGDGG
ncbi:MAG: ABC transporter substrate-binding protein [Bacteroidales bacterium]|nr:ABC transporter substrate-binding protein [Bacteroidales bacterium]